MKNAGDFLKRRWFLLALIIVAIACFGLFSAGKIHESVIVSKYFKTPVSFNYPEIPSSDVKDIIESGKIKEVIFVNKSIIIVGGPKVFLKMIDGQIVFADIVAEAKASIVANADNKDVRYYGDKIVFPGEYAALMVGPFALFILVILWSSRRAVSNLREFSKSKTRKVESSVTFADVAGIDEAKAQAEEAIHFLRHSAEWQDFGEVGVGAIVFHGPPGCGKTYLARAVAGEAKVPFFGASAAEFEGILVGAGAQKIDDFFDVLEKNAPCVGFLDEFEVVGRRRGGGFGDAGSRSYEQTTDQILHRMDGIFESKKPVLIIVATNRFDLLDEAVIRAGRFGTHVYIGPPNRKGREEILKVHAKNRPLAPDVDFKKIAIMTPNFTGAFLAELVKVAARIAIKKYVKETLKNPLRRPPRIIVQQDFLGGIKQVLHGVAKELNFTDREKEVMIVHEAGHATVGRVLPNIPPIRLVTVKPHEKAAGYVWAPSETDRYLEFVEEVKEHIGWGLAGREAEKLFYKGTFTGGATKDLKEATALAKKLVYEWGVLDEDEELGPQYFGDLIGSDIFTAKQISYFSQARLERKVGEILNVCAKRAREILSDEKFNPVFQEIKRVLSEPERGELEEGDLEKIWAKFPNLPKK